MALMRRHILIDYSMAAAAAAAAPRHENERQLFVKPFNEPVVFADPRHVRQLYGRRSAISRAQPA